MKWIKADFNRKAVWSINVSGFPYEIDNFDDAVKHLKKILEADKRTQDYLEWHPEFVNTPEDEDDKPWNDETERYVTIRWSNDYEKVVKVFKARDIFVEYIDYD